MIGELNRSDKILQSHFNDSTIVKTKINDFFQEVHTRINYYMNNMQEVCTNDGLDNIPFNLVNNPLNQDDPIMNHHMSKSDHIPIRYNPITCTYSYSDVPVQIVAYNPNWREMVAVISLFIE